MLIGVDGGMETFSLAFYEPRLRLFPGFFTGTKEQAIEYIIQAELDIYPKYNFHFVVENPDLNKAVFGAWEKMEDLIKGYKFNGVQLSEVESVFKTVCKIAQNVGQNKLLARQFINYLNVRQYPTISIAPSQRTKAITDSGERLKGISLLSASMPTKTDKYQFLTLTGHAGITNEHQRDAAMLVYDRTAKWVELQRHLQGKIS